MAKASANLFPYVHLVPAAAPASPAAGSQRLYLDSGDSNKLKRKDSSGTVTTIEGGSGGGTGILACTAYNPDTLASYSSTSTSFADVDATNLAVTFTAPASGKVLIRLTIPLAQAPDASTVVKWALREGSTTVTGTPSQVINANTGYRSTTISMVVTGLTAGDSHTYKWAWKRGAGTGTMSMFAGGQTSGDEVGAAVMEVHALP